MPKMSVEECIRVLIQDKQDWENTLKSWEESKDYIPTDKDLDRCGQRIDALSIAIQVLQQEEVLVKALSFAQSIIKSGEPWTDTCEKVIGEALASRERIR